MTYRFAGLQTFVRRIFLQIGIVFQVQHDIIVNRFNFLMGVHARFNRLLQDFLYPLAHIGGLLGRFAVMDLQRYLG
ncbi:hypothetical protein D3C76_1412560 [compost metagenome]